MITYRRSGVPAAVDLGEEKDARRFGELADSIRATFTTEYVTPPGGSCPTPRPPTPDIPAIASVARGDGVWIFVGYPTYGQGPFEQLGTPTSVPLLVGFLLVAMVEAVVGLLLWTGRRAGSVLADAGVSAEPGRNTDGSRTPPVRLGVRWRPACRPCRSVP